MSICWLLSQQKYVALVLVQSEDYYYDCFRAFALRYPTFLSLVSFLIMVVIVGFKYRSSFSILVFAWVTATRISAFSQKGSCMSSASPVWLWFGPALSSFFHVCGTWNAAIREEGLMLWLPSHIKLPNILQVQTDTDWVLFTFLTYGTIVSFTEFRPDGSRSICTVYPESCLKP